MNRAIKQKAAEELEMKLVKVMTDHFQANPDTNESDIIKLSRSNDKIWVPVCESVFGHYEYKFALRLRKKWIDKGLKLEIRGMNVDYESSVEEMEIDNEIVYNSTGLKIFFSS